MRPCISAYLPVYNQAGSLATAIGSIQAQTVPVREVIVVDDASTDVSSQVAEEAGARVVRLSSNQGRGAARARGMLECRSELVLCCDATCALAPDFVEKALPFFDDPLVAAVFGVYESKRDRTVADRWRSRHLFKVGAYTEVDDRASFATYGAMVRRQAVLDTGNFDTDLRHSEDVEIDLRLRQLGWRIVRVPECHVTSIVSNGVWKTLERYWRWNAGIGPRTGVVVYLKCVSYSIKIMAAQDLKQRDPLAALISLVCPHVQQLRSLVCLIPFKQSKP